MKLLIASILGVMLLGGCTAEKSTDVSTVQTTTTAATETVASSVPATTDSAPQTDSASQTTTNENHTPGTWAGQVKVAQPVSMFNYVGAESGDFAPMRFRNDSEAGRKILAVCSNDDLCEFTGVVEWLDEPPPPDASAIGQIVRVDSVKRSQL
jgi:outer membrane murein-binding lipoprotein Lpp